MRWFWLFIALLIVLTGVLYTQRVRSERAQQEAIRSIEESSSDTTPRRRSRERARPADQSTEQPPAQTPAQPDPEPVATEQAPDYEPVETEQSEDSADETIAEQQDSEHHEPSDDPTNAFDPGALITQFNEIEAQTNRQTDRQPENTPTEQPEQSEFDQALAQAARQTQEPDGDPSEPEQPEEAGNEAPPSYELRADGSFKIIDANIWVQGAGTVAEPYVLGWDELKSIENSYDPKKGDEELPDWLDLLDSKVVQIEGNSLVPVVATTTRELLVMKNPWDGCCIGVPPTPYDAVEVVLNHDVDFGNSAVGYGTVKGIFYLDPYVVDGWVLGIYIIEDATYRSGEGVVFPEF